MRVRGDLWGRWVIIGLERPLGRLPAYRDGRYHIAHAAYRGLPVRADVRRYKVTP